MIFVRKNNFAATEQMELDEFEKRVRNGEINPHSEICFPVITGNEFVPARKLELFQGLYQAGPITFKRHFNLQRAPWITLTLILIICGTYFFWQQGDGASTDALLRQGAKSRSLMIELSQWWRLLSANLLHVSGWHLAVNAIFLFNLGGPAEAVFRRFDYFLLLIISALGSTALSTLINPAVSCGASGIVFGVWGATAVFGIKYRTILPDKYRRYFIGSVIPYSVFALYVGFAMTGVDNWGHLGGLVAGCTTAIFLPARLLKPKDPFLVTKLATLGVLLLIIVGASNFKGGPGPLTKHRYFARNGLAVPIPQRWYSHGAERGKNTEEHSFHNRSRVGVGLETELESSPVNLKQTVAQFMTIELPTKLRDHGAQSWKSYDPVDLMLDGYPAKHIRIDVMTPNTILILNFYIVGRGYYRYVLSLYTPMWLEDAYGPVLDSILAQTRIIAPDTLNAAKVEVANFNNSASRSHLAKALILAGENKKGWEMLEQIMKQWPSAGEPTAVAAQTYWEQKLNPERGCALISHALRNREWTPELLLLGYRLHLRCNSPKTAQQLLQAGLKRFPKHKKLKRKLQKIQQ